MVRPDLVGVVEIPGLGLGAEPTHDDPGRIGAQIQGLPIQEGGWDKATPVCLCAFAGGSGVQGPKRRQFRAIPADAG
jgi:hypothetical protein